MGRLIRAALCGLVVWLSAADVGAQEGSISTTGDQSAAARGEYIFRAGICAGCHTDTKGGGAFLAGGRPIKTPFGVFYSPNITPDPDTGIGGWSDADFTRAMTEGVAPDGTHYFPIFPYTSFTGMKPADVTDLKAYLNTVPPVKRANLPHDVAAPFNWRFTVGAWKLLFFKRGPFQTRADRSAHWNRGAYLATALAHCTECHTPRNPLGGLDRDLWFAGTLQGPEGQRSPNITPHGATGIGRWSADELADLLKTGLKSNFDDVQGTMGEAVEQGFKYLSDDDLAAIADYVMSLPPIDNLVPVKAPARKSAFD